MSNLETEPEERICDDLPGTTNGIQILEPRLVPLGGPRAMTVRRTLPQRERSFIGAWCFVDHYGPDAVGERSMNVPPHPHTGLQTVSWLFAGEVEHRDSTGSHAFVRPGELNLMTAGAGISHSEVSTPATTSLHGAQLWTALPDAHRAHRAVLRTVRAAARSTIRARSCGCFSAACSGQVSTATTFSPLLGAQIDLPPHTEIALPVDARFEHGVLLDTGAVALDDETIPLHAIGYRGSGRRHPRACERRRTGPRAAARRGAAARADRDVVELHRPQPRRGRRVSRGLAADVIDGTDAAVGSAPSPTSTGRRCPHPRCRMCG